MNMNTEILPGKEEEQIFKFLDEELKNFHEIYEELASCTKTLRSDDHPASLLPQRKQEKPKLLPKPKLFPKPISKVL